MKTAIYQYWDGTPRPSCYAGVRNMREYADRIGADYKFEQNPNWLRTRWKIENGGYSAHYGAFKPLFESAWDEYDKILFVDTDVFAVDGLEENVFDHFHGETAQNRCCRGETERVERCSRLASSRSHYQPPNFGRKHISQIHTRCI